MAGASTAYHCTMSRPLMPDSARVGTSGSRLLRSALVTASGRSLPAWIWLIAPGRVSKFMSTLPPSRSVIAWPLPL
ncbi:hypothetical protein D3C72_1894860 [compost metagenome]